MLNISVNFETGQARLAQATAIKAGGDVPVRVTFSANPGNNPVIELALSPQSSEREVLAYLDVFEAENSTTYLGTLDANDTRLIAHLATKAAAQVTLDVEVVVLASGSRRPFPNFAATVQAPTIVGPESSEGGPVFLTQATKANQSEAEAGSNNVKWMSPLRVWQAIAAWWQTITLTLSDITDMVPDARVRATLTDAEVSVLLGAVFTTGVLGFDDTNKELTAARRKRWTVTWSVSGGTRNLRLPLTGAAIGDIIALSVTPPSLTTVQLQQWNAGPGWTTFQTITAGTLYSSSWIFDGTAWQTLSVWLGLEPKVISADGSVWKITITNDGVMGQTKIAS